MSLCEFDLFVRGYMKRIETQQELLAWHACNIMNCWSKKKLTPTMLLGKTGNANPQTLEELQVAMKTQRDKVEADLAQELVLSDGDIDFGYDESVIDLTFADDADLTPAEEDA